MSTDMKPFNTERMGQVSVTQFAGGKEMGRCFQFTSRTRSDSGQKDMFQCMSFSKADMVAMAKVMMECAADMRDEDTGV